MDKYTKLAKIGSGSFGCAYLVTRKADPLAKKFVIKEIRMDPRDQQSALREAKLLAALDHPNIIACKESFLLGPPPPVNRGRAPAQQQPVLCIVTEYADGGDLRKKLEQQIASRTRLKEADVLDLFVQCCLALKHLHDRKIIHRDIKPENVFLMKSNVVKLGDFGVATVLSNTLACAETMTGTPYYTSPEICLGRRYNSKTDIWSLGCVLYELVTFAHAFNGRSQRQLFDNIMNASFIPIATVLGAGTEAGGYSRGLMELVGEMLRKNPRDRPSVNQIIKKPIMMERIQGFLSERALADELNHTVLHGHHIFRKNNNPVVNVLAPSPVPAEVKKFSAPSAGAAADVVRRAEVVFADKKKVVCAGAKAAPLKQLGAAAAPKKKKAAPVPSSRSPSVLLNKKSRSFKKAAAPSPSPSIAAKSPVADRKRAAGAGAGAAPSPSPRYLTPTKTLELKNRLLLQKKKAIVDKAKQGVLRARLVPSAAAGGGETKNPHVGDRISAFNAQWQEQRQQLLHNLPTPPPSSSASGVASVSAALLPPPPPAPVSAAAPKKAAGIDRKLSEYPKPVITAAPEDQHQVFVPPTASISSGKARKGTELQAAAAKQRDAMRRDIRSRKQELLKKAGAEAGAPDLAGNRLKGAGTGASPLDDPIILVQNLPHFYQMMEPPPSASNSGNSFESSSDAPTLVSPPPAPVSAVAPVSNSDLGADNDAIDEEEPGVPMSLEFERMVLQLKSVIESSSLDDEVSDADDDEDDEPDTKTPFQPRIPDETEEEVSPLPPAYDHNVSETQSLPTELNVSILQEPNFTKALQALLAVKNIAGETTEATRILSTVAPEHKPMLLWMRSYVTKITTSSPTPATLCD